MHFYSCNASFHKYCYGISEIPSSDYYCNGCSKKIICSKHGKYFIFENYFKLCLKVPKLRQCILCPLDFAPVKLVQNAWFHLTCLYMHNLGK